MQTKDHTRPLKVRKNLTRFTYETTSFQGWRLAVCRQGKSFIKYFSDKQFGGSEAALAVAEATLNKILNAINESKKQHGKVTNEVLEKIETYIQI